MRLHREWGRVQASAILLAFLVLAGPGAVWAEQAPLGSEPPAPAPLILAPPGAAPPPALSALAGEVRALRERVEALERTLTGLLEALPVVASGVMGVPPAGRELADPVANPLGFARLQPGQVAIRHGLGAAEVTIHLAVVSPEGRISYQVPAGALFAAAPTPPDGTFTIFNATESPLAVRWWAILHAAPGETGTTPGTP